MAGRCVVVRPRPQRPVRLLGAVLLLLGLLSSASGQCPAGTQSVSGQCEDIDACLANPCQGNATCTDLPAPALSGTAGRNCTCNPGLEDVGGQCQDINECACDQAFVIEETFSTSVAPVGWTDRGSPVSTIGTCGSFPEHLGGNTIFGVGAAPVKTFILPPNTGTVSVTVDLLVLDSWDSERWFVDVNDQQVFRSDRIATSRTFPNECGRSFGDPGLQSMTMAVQLPPGATTLKLAIRTNLNSNPGDEAFGISRVLLAGTAALPCTHDCGVGEACVNVFAGFTCENVDACLANPCDPNATCTDLAPPAAGNATGRVCTCDAGFEGDGDSCVDIDACLANPCQDNATCTDLPAPALSGTAGRNCTCNPGLEDVGGQCQDINECACDQAFVIEETFSTSVAPVGWTDRGSPVSTIGTCGSFPEHLGGNTIFGVGAAPVKTFILPPNTGTVSVTVDLLVLDSWDSERWFVDVNDQQVFRSDRIATSRTFPNECGRSFGDPGLQSMTMAVQLPPGATTLKLAIRTNLNSNPGDEAFGISRVLLAGTAALPCTHDCGVGEACVNVFAGFTCENVDACLANPCDPNATCTDLAPPAAGNATGRVCTCDAGFEGDGDSCVDIDACLANPCQDNATCTDLPAPALSGTAGRNCTCNPGLEDVGGQCQDINECACDQAFVIEETFSTSVAPVGWTDRGSPVSTIGTCGSFPEHLGGNTIFGVGAAPVKTFILPPNTGTVSVTVDLLVLDSWDSERWFVDVNDQNVFASGTIRHQGSPNECGAGFGDPGLQTANVDVQLPPGAATLKLAIRTNINTSPDDEAFGISRVLLTSGAGLPCTHDCGVGEACVNVFAGFTCENIDACLANPCDPNATCTDLAPPAADNATGRVCACDAGFEGDGDSCVDIDECARGLDNCDANANCNNTFGGFSCACKAGFDGNGTACDRNECFFQEDNCAVDADCANGVGNASKFVCSCKLGFSGDGLICADIDECAAQPSGCDPTAVCENGIGSFSCRCPSGLFGDGTRCFDIFDSGLALYLNVAGDAPVDLVGAFSPSPALAGDVTIATLDGIRGATLGGAARDGLALAPPVPSWAPLTNGSFVVAFYHDLGALARGGVARNVLASGASNGPALRLEPGNGFVLSASFPGASRALEGPAMVDGWHVASLTWAAGATGSPAELTVSLAVDHVLVGTATVALDLTAWAPASALLVGSDAVPVGRVAWYTRTLATGDATLVARRLLAEPVDRCVTAPCAPGSSCRNAQTDFECLCPSTHWGRLCDVERGVADLSQTGLAVFADATALDAGDAAPFDLTGRFQLGAAAAIGVVDGQQAFVFANASAPGLGLGPAPLPVAAEGAVAVLVFLAELPTASRTLFNLAGFFSLSVEADGALVVRDPLGAAVLVTAAGAATAPAWSSIAVSWRGLGPAPARRRAAGTADVSVFLNGDGAAAADDVPLPFVQGAQATLGALSTEAPQPPADDPTAVAIPKFAGFEAALDGATANATSAALFESHFCRGVPCLNGGLCSPLPGAPDDGSVATACACAPGFSGAACEVVRVEGCPAGFFRGGDGECQDVDECLNAPCDARANCTNRAGGFECACQAGFEGTGLSCVDTNECVTTANCHGFATCTNLVGTFSCRCNDGFSGDGVACTADNVGAALDAIDVAQLKDTLNTTEAGSVASVAIRTSISEFAAQAVGGLDPADEAGVSKLADVLSAAVANAEGAEIPQAVRSQVTETTSALFGLLVDQEALRLAAAQAQIRCGDAVCSPFETCGSCAADCGACRLVESGLVITQFRSDVAQHGTARVFLTLPAVDRFLSITAAEAAAPVTVTTLELDADPVASKPAGTKFGGVVLVVDEVFGDTLFAAPVAVRAELAGLAVASAEGVFDLFLFDPARGEWLAPEAQPTPCGPTAYDAAAKVLTSEVCAFGQYGVFVRAFQADTGSEETLIETLGGTLVPVLVGEGGEEVAINEEELQAEKESSERALAVLETITDALGDGLEAGDPPTRVVTPKVSLQIEKAVAADLAGAQTAVTDEPFPTVRAPANLEAFLAAAPDADPAQPVVATSVFFSDFPFATATTSGGVLEYNLKQNGVEIRVGTVGDAAAPAANATNNTATNGTDAAADNSTSAGAGEPGVAFVFSFGVPANAEPFQIKCVFFDPTLANPDCPLANKSSPACLGAFSTEGVAKDEAASTDTSVVCVSSHLTAFAADVDFTISAPEVTLNNFNPENSYIIYATFGSFYVLIAIAFVYSRIERLRFVRYQTAVREGRIEDRFAAEEAEADRKRELRRARQRKADALRPPSRLRLFLRSLKTKLHESFTSRHSWMAVVWPTGRRVYPKRFIKICSLWAAISMALGLNAVFTYTATQNTPEGETRTVNTFGLKLPYIGRVRVPLEGIYSFLLSFPFFLILSLSFGRYSVLIDFLRKADPERFLNHISNNRYHARTLQDGRVALVAAPARGAGGGGGGAGASARGRVVAFGNDGAGAAVASDFTYGFGDGWYPADDGAGVGAAAGVRPVGSRTPGQSRRGRNKVGAAAGVWPGDGVQETALDFGELSSGSTMRVGDRALPDEPFSAIDVGGAGKGAHASGSGSGSSTGNPYAFAGLFVGSGIPNEYVSVDGAGSDIACDNGGHYYPAQGVGDQRARERLAEEERQRELDEVLEPIVRKMIFWKRFSIGQTLFLVTGGMLLALLYVGAYSPDQQRRWLKAVGEFIIFSAILTSPFFLFVLATSEAWSDSKKKKAGEGEGEGKGEGLEQILELNNRRALATVSQSKSAKVMMKAMLQVELGRALRANFNFSVL